jgi:broad specificity phosphatase PhoE
VGGILPGQTPPAALGAFVLGCEILIASTRLRSIESAQLLAPGREFSRHEVLIEAPLPPPPWPAWIRLSPRIWGFLARFWWWFFNHHDEQETRREAETRADEAARQLIELAAGGQDVLVVAHGFFNTMVGLALARRGWRCVDDGGFKYWAARRFELSQP